MKKGIFLFIILLIYCSCSSDDSEHNIITEPLEAETHLNVSYGSHPQQVYDLYLPKGRTAEKTKVLMLIHGGAWSSGDKRDLNSTVTLLKALHPDHAIVNVNYVLATTENFAFPNQFLDIKSIVNKLTSEKGQLQINPQFGMIGTSAGAHIAMMYDYVYDTENQVKFVANIVGPSDFTDSFYQENFDIPNIILALVDRTAYPQGTDYLKELSPLYHVSNASSPICMFYGNQDPLVPQSNGVSLKQKLDQLGIYNTLKIYQGGHGDDWSTQDVLEAQSIISDYINRFLP